MRQAPRLLGGRVLHLSQGGMPWTRVVVEEMPEVLLVLYPDSDGQQYQLKTVPVEAVPSRPAWICRKLGPGCASRNWPP